MMNERKNEYNIEHHGISFKQAARVFFDYDRIELYDEENSEVEDRYDTIGDLSVGYANISSGETVIEIQVHLWVRQERDQLFLMKIVRRQPQRGL